MADRREREQPLDVALREAHHRAPQRRQGAERDQDRPQLLGMRGQGAGEDRPVEARHGVYA